MAERQSLSAEIMALRLAAEGESTRLRRKLGGIMGLNRSYRRLFFDQQGRLKPEAREVLTDLVETAGIGLALPDLSHESLALAEGQRRIVLHLFGRFRLPDGRLDQLEHDLRQAEEEHER